MLKIAFNLLGSHESVSMMTVAKKSKSKNSDSRTRKINKEIEEGKLQQNRRRQKVSSSILLQSLYFLYQVKADFQDVYIDCSRNIAVDLGPTVTLPIISLQY